MLLTVISQASFLVSPGLLRKLSYGPLLIRFTEKEWNEYRADDSVRMFRKICKKTLYLNTSYGIILKKNRIGVIEYAGRYQKVCCP